MGSVVIVSISMISFESQYAEYSYAECCYVVCMLSFIMLSDVNNKYHIFIVLLSIIMVCVCLELSCWVSFTSNIIFLLLCLVSLCCECRYVECLL